MTSTAATQDVAMEAEEEKDTQESSLYKEDSFRMYCMKVLPCSKRYCHDWTTCPFSHPGEKARRRDPRTQPHTGIACPDRKKEGTCVRGDNCPYAHNVFEYWLHPTRYRTQLCNDGTKCKRHICFFAHSLEELRVPTCKPFVPPDALAAATTAAAADIARKAGGAPLDAATLRQLAEAVMSSAPQAGVQPVDLAQNLLQSNPSADALVRQLAQMQVQNQQVNYQQQQQDQLNAMSALTSYLREAQARQQAQTQANPPQSNRASAEARVGDPSWATAMSERQQLAFRSLSDAAVDQRWGARHNSELVRAALQQQAPAPSSSSFPGDVIQSQSQAQSVVNVPSAGMSLAQQSLLYAPSQQSAQHSSNPQSLFQPPHFPPRATANHFQNNSLDMGHRWSDPGRRPSFGQPDWMSANSTPGSRYSQESEFLSMGHRDTLAAAGRLHSFDSRVRNSIDSRMHSFDGRVQNSLDGRMQNSLDGRMHNSFDLDWAGRPGNDALSALMQAQGQDPFNPFQGQTFFHPRLGPQDSPFPPTFEAFTRRPYLDSQDSNASTSLHTESRPSMGDRPSLDSMRSGFGSPPSPSLLRANPPTQHDSLFAFGSNQQQQYQPTQAPPPGFGGMRGSGGASQGGHQSKGGLPLGSGRGLETMPEDDDTMGTY